MRSSPLGRARERDGVDSDDPSRRLDDDTAFRLLDNRHRRAAVRHLASASQSVSLPALVDAVASEAPSSADPTPTDAPAAEGRDPGGRRRVSVALQQVHLPKLAGAGVVTYDRRAGVVTPTPALDPLADRLARSTRDDADRGGTRGGSAAGARAVAVPTTAGFVAAAVTFVGFERAVAAASAPPALVAAVAVALATVGAVTLAGGDRPSGD